MRPGHDQPHAAVTVANLEQLRVSRHAQARPDGQANLTGALNRGVEGLTPPYAQHHVTSQKETLRDQGLGIRERDVFQRFRPRLNVVYDTVASSGQETRRVQRAEETERERLDRELAARTAASAAQLAQIEEQQKKIEAQARMQQRVQQPCRQRMQCSDAAPVQCCQSELSCGGTRT